MSEPIRTKGWPPYEWRLQIDGHSRNACLMRPNEWCRGIGYHPGQCRVCPVPPRTLYWDGDVWIDEDGNRTVWVYENGNLIKRLVEDDSQAERKGKP